MAEEFEDESAVSVEPSPGKLALLGGAVGTALGARRSAAAAAVGGFVGGTLGYVTGKTLGRGATQPADETDGPVVVTIGENDDGEASSADDHGEETEVEADDETEADDGTETDGETETKEGDDGNAE